MPTVMPHPRPTPTHPTCVAPRSNKRVPQASSPHPCTEAALTTNVTVCWLVFTSFKGDTGAGGREHLKPEYASGTHCTQHALCNSTPGRAASAAHSSCQTRRAGHSATLESGSPPSPQALWPNHQTAGRVNMQNTHYLGGTETL